VPEDLVALDRRIADALLVLRGARACTRHSPTAEARSQEALAERTLNELLDRRPVCQMRHQARLLAG
jgi:hypothetical protein